MSMVETVLMDASAQARFWSKVDRKDKSECWLWRAYKSASGYGQLTIGGAAHRSHRIAYMLGKGNIPNGYFVCHHCDNPPCCNPDHLFIGTARDNNIDKTRKGRNVRPPRDESAVEYIKGSQCHFSRLNEGDVLAIRALKLSGVRTRDLAKKYNVHRTLIWQICAKKIWRHLP